MVNVARVAITMVLITSASAEPQEQVNEQTDRVEVEAQARLQRLEALEHRTKMLAERVEEVRRDQLDYRLAREVIKETYATNFNTVSAILSIALAVFTFLGFFGLRDVRTVQSEFRDELKRIRGVREDHEAKVDALVRQVSDAEEQASRAQEEFSNAEANIRQAEEKISEAERKIAEAEQKISTSEEKIAQAEARIAEADRRLQDFQQENFEQSKRIRVVELVDRASSLYQSGKQALAKEILESALEIDSANAGALNLKRNISLASQDYETTFEVVRSLVSADPDRAPQWQAELVEMAALTGKVGLAQAVLDAERASIERAHSWEVVVTLEAIIHWRRGDYKSMFEKLRHGFELLPPSGVFAGTLTWSYRDAMHAIAIASQTPAAKALTTWLQCLAGLELIEDARAAVEAEEQGVNR